MPSAGDHVITVLEERKGRVHREDIISEVLERTDKAEQTVVNALTNLYQAGKIDRPETSVYQSASHGDGARARANTRKPASTEAEAGTQATEVMELDVTTGGGDGGVAIQERPIARYEVDYIPLSDLRGRHPDDAFATRMIGRSMAPELQPNDRIVVQPYPEGAQRIETDAIYVFRIDGEIQVKQLEWKPGKRLVCKALSKAHDGFDLDLSDDGPIAEGDIDFAIIGRVWGHFCLL